MVITAGRNGSRTEGLMHKGYYVLVFLAVVNVTISLYYYLLVVRAMFLRRSENPIPFFKNKLYMRLGLLITVVGILVLGMYSPLYQYIYELSSSLSFKL